MSYYVVDEDFPSKAQLRAALVLALATGIMGFLVSYGLFVENNKDIQVSSVDRRAAEGYAKRARKARSRQGQAPVMSGKFSYVAYTPTRPQPRRFTRLTDDNPEQEIVAAATRTRPQLAESTKTSKTDTGEPNRNKTQKTKKNRSSTKKKQAPEVDPRALTYPEVDRRPPSVGAAVAWRSAQGSLVRLEHQDRSTTLGVVIDPSGLVVSQASACEPYALRGINVAGNRVSAQIKAVDSENDIALLQLSPGNYTALPLAPSPPDPGERLALGSSYANSRAPVDAISRGLISRGTFLFQGVSPPTARGGPVINDRGEVSGVVLGRLRGFPGHSFNLAADSAAIQRLWKGRPPSSGGRDPVVRSCTRALIRAVPALSDRQKPTRSNSKVEPGKTLGNFELGMTSSQLEAELGAGEQRDYASGVTVLSYPAQVVTFYLVADRTVAIETTYNFYTSKKGLCVGTPVDGRRLDREFEDYLRGPLRRGEHVVSEGLELTIDESGKVSRLIVVPGV